jgi:hypothetical protein
MNTDRARSKSRVPRHGPRDHDRARTATPTVRVARGILPPRSDARVLGLRPLAVRQPRSRTDSAPGASGTPETTWQRQLDVGEVANQADIARPEGITRARVTQVMHLLCLSPKIQNHILAMRDVARRPAITERALRPIAQIPDHVHESRVFEDLIHHDSNRVPTTRITA